MFCVRSFYSCKKIKTQIWVEFMGIHMGMLR